MISHELEWKTRCIMIKKWEQSNLKILILLPPAQA